MQSRFDAALKITWLTLLVYWMWSARRIKHSSRSEPALARFAKYWLPLLVAGALLGPGDWFGDSFLHERFVPDATWVSTAGLALVIAGVALACWARHILGRNWSSVVQLKQDHELVERGPYRHVRHPIYTGLLLAFLGTAVMIGEWRGPIAVAIVFVSFWHKLRLEERWLGEYFGVRYADYRQRTKALLPGIL